jgi:DNA-binding SARP family transcriptional activator
MLQVDPPSLELRCLGAPTAYLDGHPAPQVVTWRKHFALLIYLALTPERTRTRTHLVGLLWPEKNEALARRSLNQAIVLLRAQLGAERLVSEGDSLTILETKLHVDALQLEALAEHRPAEAAQLVRGDFLEGLVLDDAPAFEEWASHARQNFRSVAVRALVAAGEEALAAVRCSEAISLAIRGLQVEPFSELAERLLMRASALSGDIAGALAAYNEFSTRLTSELGEKPSRDLEEFSERVRSMRWRRFTPIRVEEEPPLVGREKISSEAFALIESGMRDGPRTLFVTGDPGIGRTRLLVECAERLALGGAVIASARPLEADQDSPWCTLRALLRAGLLKAPGSAGTVPEALDVLSTLETEPDIDAALVSAALGSLLEAVAEEQPVGILIDDGHCSDGPSLVALAVSVSSLKQEPVVLVVTSLDSWDHAPLELLQLRGSIGRGLQGSAIRLKSFSDEEARELVAACSPWCRTDSDRERLARRVVFETGGNPFLMVTLLRGLAEASYLRRQALQWPPPGGTIDSPLPISVPSLARRAIMARVGDLDDESRRVLQAASIAASPIDFELTASIAGLSSETVQQRFGLLERRRFVVFDGERHVIAAPILADVVRTESLLPGELHLLRSRAVSYLRGRTDPEAELLRVQLQASTSPGATAFDDALAVVQGALSRGSGRRARLALAAAMRSLPADDEGRRRALDRLKSEVH